MGNIKEQLWRIGKNTVRIGAAASIIASAACFHAKSPEQPTPTPAVKSLETPTPEYVVLLDRFYPELREAGFQEKERKIITSNNPLWKPTITVNYTDHKLNFVSVYSMYNVFETIAGINPEMKIRYTINDTERMFALRPKNQVKTRTTVLVPDDAPRPHSRWQGGLFKASESSGGTVTDHQTGSALSYVQTVEASDELFTTKEDEATRTLAIEICQQTVNVVLLDTKEQKVVDPTEQRIAQEIVCNGFGIAVAARFLNIPYDRYAKFVRDYGMIFPSIPDERHRIGFSEASYSRFPTDGGVLK